MEKQRYSIINPQVRQNALRALMAMPDGYTATFAPPTRSGGQNDFFHSICSDIAKSGMEWAGKPRKADEWKVLLVSGHTKATQGEVEFVPGLEGEFVNIRESTAKMSVKRATSLLEYTLAWCASHNIPLTDTRRQGYVRQEAA